MILSMLAVVVGVGATVALVYCASLALEREVQRLKREARPLALKLSGSKSAS